MTYPTPTPYADTCDPTPPVKVNQPAAQKISTYRTTVDDVKVQQLAGPQARARRRTVTNQGDGAGAGSVVYVSGEDGKGNLKTQGVIVPVGAGRDFATQDALYVVSATTGLPAGGNIVDLVNEYDAG